MKKTKLEILQGIINRKIAGRINLLDQSNSNQFVILENCFNNIDYMKSKIYIYYRKKLKIYVIQNLMMDFQIFMINLILA